MIPNATERQLRGIRGRLREWQRRRVVDRFHRLYFRTRIVEKVEDNWLGRRVIKYPGDLMIYQELLYELRPDVVVETGTHSGGSALFFASICDLLGKGEVISIDRREPPPVEHPRIRFLTGDSTDPAVVELVRKAVAGKEQVLVTLDSWHRKEHVLKELAAYADFVPVEGYLVVEDTKLNGHPVVTPYAPDQGPGPMEAVDEFLAKDPRFVPDRSRERYLLTSQPRGWLRRVR